MKTTEKRANIADNSRAAFYLQLRGPGWGALRAWEAAPGRRASWLSRQLAYEDSQAILAALWEKLGKKEPKRYSDAGEELTAARQLMQSRQTTVSHSAAWAFGPSQPYAGTWQTTPGEYFCQDPDSVFRDYQDAGNGYFDNPHGESSKNGDGLILPVIAQLPGQAGQARFVAGYRNGSNDVEGATFDLATIYESAGDDHDTAQRDATRASDSMAEHAAEQERGYQVAWRAGSDWAELGESVESWRSEALAILAERRAVRGRVELPAICQAIRNQVTALRDNITEAREKRAELARGDAELLWFFWSDRDLSGLESFADGAGLTTDQARAVCI